MSRERDHWVIPSNAGITDYNRVPRIAVVRRANGEVILYAASDDVDFSEAPCLRMSNELAERLGLFLQCAAEANRLQKGHDR